jgi:hypothetical protein
MPPAGTPYTVPVTGSTVARVVLLLVHTPPLTPSLSGIVPFWQNDVAPAIGVGVATVNKKVVLPH